jgi:hypothetical protein
MVTAFENQKAASSQIAKRSLAYSTVTLFARFRGLSIDRPFSLAT